jgi:hypothetical protein
MLPGQLIDIAAAVPPLASYRFLSTSGTLTIKGYFVNEHGNQTGSSFSGTVNTTEAETWEDVSGATLPTDAVGFRGSFSVAAYYSLLPGSETDFEANPTNYPQIPAGNDIRIGRVAEAESGSAGQTQAVTITQPDAIVGPADPVIDSYTQKAINLAAGANQVLVSSAASKQIWVYGLGFSVNAAGTVSFQDEDDVALSGIMPIAANGGLVSSPSGNFAMPLWKLGTDKDLEVDIVTSELDGWLTYAIVSV